MEPSVLCSAFYVVANVFNDGVGYVCVCDFVY